MRLFTGILALTMFVISGVAGDRLTGNMNTGRSVVYGTGGMVATSHPLAAQAGIAMLKQGGSAVDAAIAVNAVLGLMEPTGSGVGGDLFAIVYDQETGRLHGLNASGPASRDISLAAIRAAGHEQMPYYGGLPVTVPGCVAGWDALHREFGRLPLKTVLAPAIGYAENGFPMTEVIGYYWGRGVANLQEYAEFQQTYAPGGKVPGEGDIFRNPNLANTYRIIADKGRDGFYTGGLAERIVAAVREHGGTMSLQDLAHFQPEWVDPVSVNYRGVDVWELPPNGQGIAALQMLQMLNNFDLKAMGHNSADYLHTLIEVKKLAYEDRAAFYADMRFADINLDRLLSESYAKERLTHFDPDRCARELPAGDGILEQGDTVYLTVADGQGNVISLIQSNYLGFGSGVVPKDSGFTLQDRGSLFSLDPDHPNAIAPGKRPFHTIIPAMVTRGGKPLFSFGVMGGSMQPQGHVQVLCNILDFGMNIQEAGDAPRFRHGGSSQPTGQVMKTGGIVYLESGVGTEVRRELMGRGHRIMDTVGGFGGYQGIWINPVTGVLAGATESRKDGCAIGF